MRWNDVRGRNAPFETNVRVVAPFAVALSTALTVAWDGALSGQEALDSEPLEARISVSVLAPGESIVVDGVPEESIWSRSQVIMRFSQRDPDEGAPASLETRIALAMDAEALYVAAWLAIPAAELHAGLTRRDDPGNAEYLAVYLDTFWDRRTAYAFAVTAAGVRLDWHHPEDSETVADPTFDPVWEAASSRGADGWTAELRIPFSQVRFNAGENLTWGLNAKRVIPSRNEEVYWQLIPRTETGWASRFGVLEGLGGVGSSTRLEVSPYFAAAGHLTDRDLIEPGDPFQTAAETSIRAGLDAKVGLGPNLTLDVTVNPDFGQVEFDPFVVNLSAFETVFDERRPFFVESAHLFRLPGKADPTYLFSRRIGRRLDPPDWGDFQDVPEQATILGATTLTGRLSSGLSVAALAARTASHLARVAIDGQAITQTLAIEPSATWGALRLRQEIGGNRSAVGVMLSGVRRSGTEAVPEDSRPVRDALSGGIDWHLRTGSGDYEVAGHIGASAVRGDSAGLDRVQRSSRHYLQRPDQAHVTLDPARESLLGSSASLQVSRRGGSRWLWDTGVEFATPGWEINEVGQRTRSDEIEPWLDVTYRDTRPGPLFRRWSVELGTGSRWNFGGVRTSGWLSLRGTGTWRNFMETGIRFLFVPRAMSDDLSRGGPLVGRPHDWTLGIDLGGNPTDGTRWSIGVFRGNQNLAPDWFFDASLAIDPGGSWSLSTAPRFNRRRSRRHLFHTLEDGPAATFGRRYVFSAVEQSEVALPLRVSLALTPDLSFELSAEPFAASARFFEFGELPAPRSHDLLTYGTAGTTIETRPGVDAGLRYRVSTRDALFHLPDRDFSVRSFRSSLVARWEWRPGSSIALVWRHDRSVRSAGGSIVSPGDLTDGLTVPGTHSLIVKARRWLSW